MQKRSKRSCCYNGQRNFLFFYIPITYFLLDSYQSFLLSLTRMLSALVYVTLAVIWQRTTKWWERKWRRLESGYKAPSKHHKDSIRRPALDRHRSQESGSCSGLGDFEPQSRNSRDRLVDISSTSRRFVRSNVRYGRVRSREIVPRKRRGVLILRSRCPFVRAKIAL